MGIEFALPGIIVRLIPVRGHVHCGDAVVILERRDMGGQWSAVLFVLPGAHRISVLLIVWSGLVAVARSRRTSATSVPGHDGDAHVVVARDCMRFVAGDSVLFLCLSGALRDKLTAFGFRIVDGRL